MHSLTRKFRVNSLTWLKLPRRWESSEDEDTPPKALYRKPPPFMCEIDKLSLNPDWQQPRVVIIGAGVAGITAACRLAQRGIDNFIILEAYNRPGGRIWSCWLGDVSIELGCGWDLPNVAEHLAYKLRSGHDPWLPGMPAAPYHKALLNQPISGLMENPPTIKAFYRYKQIEQEAKRLFYYGSSKQHGSMVNFISLRVQQELHEFPKEHQHDAARVMFGLAQMELSRGPTDKAMLWADSQGCFMAMPGGGVRVPLGITGLLAPLLRDIPPRKICYCKPVNIVYWGTTQKKGYRAIVATTDGCQYPADYVIVTVPLGVLMNRYHNMFCPALPSCKACAITSQCVLHCNKIFLEYCRPFWYWSNTDIHFDFCNNDLAHRTDWTRGIKSIKPEPHSQHVLGVIVTGKEALAMELASDRDIANGINDILRWATGNKYLPDPCNMIRSNWTSDPFFCGAHSQSMNMCDTSSQLQLAGPIPGADEPCPPILMFAGEATVPGYNSTLGGARLSGIREAERILHLTRLYQGPPVARDEGVSIDPCACVAC